MAKKAEETTNEEAKTSKDAGYEVADAFKTHSYFIVNGTVREIINSKIELTKEDYKTLSEGGFVK